MNMQTIAVTYPLPETIELHFASVQKKTLDWFCNLNCHLNAVYYYKKEVEFHQQQWLFHYQRLYPKSIISIVDEDEKAKNEVIKRASDLQNANDALKLVNL